MTEYRGPKRLRYRPLVYKLLSRLKHLASPGLGGLILVEQMFWSMSGGPL